MKELSDVDIERIRSHFDYFDENNSGKLELKEFRKLFAVIAPEAKRAEADLGFEAIDVNASGEIEFDEFVEWWQSNWSVY